MCVILVVSLVYARQFNIRFRILYVTLYLIWKLFLCMHVRLIYALYYYLLIYFTYKGAGHFCLTSL